METVQSYVENAVVSSVFTLPGFTVEGLPICNFKVKGSRVMVRFFQKDVFSVCVEKMDDIEHGLSSITIHDADDVASDDMRVLLNAVARSTRVDAAFIKSIQLRDYGYYDSKLLKPKKQEDKK